MTRRRVISGLPVYNGEAYVGKAIESHLAQSFGDFDLVISDNGSTDATREICEDFARRDNRVKYFRVPENRGLLWNHRRVMEAIEAPDQYFRWAAADDIMEPRLLEAMVDVLDKRPTAEAAAPETKNINDQGVVIGSMGRTLDLRSTDVYERAWGVLCGAYQMVIAFGLFRASRLLRMRTKPNYLGWDFVFIWELALRGEIVQPEGVALLRRFHAGATSHVKTAKELKKWVEPIAKAGGTNFPHWTWAYERARSLMAAPLSPRQRLRVGSLLIRHTMWQRQNLVRDVTQATRRTLRLSDDLTF